MSAQEQDETPPIHRLADLATAYSQANVPPEIRRQAGESPLVSVLCILDTLGCIIAGCALPEPRQMLEAELAAVGQLAPGLGCTVIGRGIRLPATSAARANAFAGDQLELNDLLGGHASIGVVNAALSLAEKQNSTGEELVMAVVAGLETTTRLFNSYYMRVKPYSDSLLIPVALPSTVGAAATCSRLLGLSPSQTREALAIGAGACTVCPAEVIFRSGGTMKPLCFGALPAETAIYAAHQAQAGLTGPPRILDGGMGYFSTAATSIDYGVLYGPGWGLANVTRKVHSCCGHTHSGLDGLVALRVASPTWPPAKLEIGLPANIIQTVGGKSLPPTTPNEARFHMPYLLAVLVASSSPVSSIVPHHILDREAFLADQAVVRAMASITFFEAFDLDTFYHSSIVRGTFVDGEVKEVVTTSPKGSPGDPLDEQGVVAKFEALVVPVAGAVPAGMIRDAVLGLEVAADLRPLWTLLGSDWGGS